MNIHVIVRAAAERTASHCCEELARQAGGAAHVSRVELTPFWRTLREGLTIGLKSGCPWVLTVDADVIPSDDVIQRANTWIGRIDARTAVVSGMIQDKFLGCIRFGGIRLYRASIIPEVLDAMPALGDNVRPESTAIQNLAGKGWKHETLPELVGLHDYEQYYRDIYRKAFLHMQKHGNKSAGFLELWRNGAKTDPDFRAALAGAADALLWTGDVDCDASHEAYRGTDTLARIGLQEKGPLTFDRASYRSEVDRLSADIDAGIIKPVSPLQQEAYDRSLADEDVLRRIERVGSNLKLLSGLTSMSQAAVVHQVRRAIPDDVLLGSFSVSELVKCIAGRICRVFRK